MTGLLNRIDRVLCDQAGIALLAAVLAMGVLGFLGATFASLVVQHQYAAVNQGQSLKALYLAEAGFELAIQELVENADKAFNGVAGDGEIGRITNVPIGSGTVSVTKGTETPPVFTATGTVGDVRRVIAMTIDVKNLVQNDPVFNDAVNLPTNWPETILDADGASGIQSVANSCCSPSALKTWTTGPSKTFIAEREQVLNPTIPPPGRRVVVRLSYMRDRTASTVDTQKLNLILVLSDASPDKVWQVGGAVPDTDKGVWFVAEFRGRATSSTLTTQKVRLFYHLVTTKSASSTDEASGWFDNIQVLTVNKSAWSEP